MQEKERKKKEGERREKKEKKKSPFVLYTDGDEEEIKEMCNEKEKRGGERG